MKLSTLHEAAQEYSEQERDYWCGPASLQMILRRFGLDKSQKSIARLAKTTKKRGTDRLKMHDVVRPTGLKCHRQQNATLADLERFIDENKYLIVNYIEPTTEDGHYAVVRSISKSHITLDDPYNGEGFKISLKEFIPRWEKRSKWVMAISK